MQDILTCAMGLDIHRDVIVACLAKGELGTDPEIEIRSFSTLIPEMRKLRDWVLEAECRYVAMESTGIYWQPIYEMLEPCFDGRISILVVNARHMKNVPGRKTDMRDAQWIATLLRAGLLKGSFIPDKTFRELRHLTRYRIIYDCGVMQTPTSIFRDADHRLLCGSVLPYEIPVFHKALSECGSLEVRPVAICVPQEIQEYCMELFGENVQIAAASHDLFAKRVNGQIYRPLVEKYIAGEKRL